MKQLGLFADLDDPSPGDRETASVRPVQPDPGLAGLAARLDPRLRLGTSSWSFPGWAGLVYAAPASKQVLSRDGLLAYSRHPLLATVGVDSGFYAPLEAARLARWAAQTPESFRFLVKAPALVTDPVRRLGGGRGGEANPGFLDAALATDCAVGPFVEGLGERGGVLLFQFPPLGRQMTGEPRRFAEALYRFLRRLPPGPTYAVELRDALLLTSDFAAALHHGGAAPGLAVHPRLPPVGEQMALFGVDPSRPPKGPLVIRWLLRRNRGYEEARDLYHPFDSLSEPDPENRAAITALVHEALAQGREVLVIVNNKAEGSSPLSLIALARDLVGVAGGPVAT